ncbi:hypothetical protein [Dactylosporangium sp. NPDC048998]|uniref:hypothetical protein n=1 Tax=Dactylosporangium sp. NPDC048998 TaxID=3363976 RepID=UPI003722EF45
MTGQALTRPIDGSPINPVPREGGWLGTGHGVLARVAGTVHTPTQAAASVAYLSTDLVHTALSAVPSSLPIDLASDTLPLVPPPVLRQGATRFYDVHQVLPPPHGRSVPELLRRLPRLPHVAGLHPLPWTPYVAVDLTREVTYLDPRHAFNRAVTRGGWLHDQLTALAHALGDPGNVRGMLGLSGTAALDPSRLHTPQGTPMRLDLVLFLALAPSGLDIAAALRSIGAELPADLADDDPRLIRYRAHRRRSSPTDAASDERFRARRSDVAWLGNVQLDLTRSGPRQRNTELPYATPPLYQTTRGLTILNVTDSCPITLQVTGARPCTRVVVTARGFQTVFRSGDRITVVGAMHGDPTDPDRPRFLSVDDHAGHRITLTAASRRRPARTTRNQPS